MFHETFKISDLNAATERKYDASVCVCVRHSFASGNELFIQNWGTVEQITDTKFEIREGSMHKAPKALAILSLSMLITFHNRLQLSSVSHKVEKPFYISRCRHVFYKSIFNSLPQCLISFQNCDRPKQMVKILQNKLQNVSRILPLCYT
jgi:hypothetical protein